MTGGDAKASFRIPHLEAVALHGKCPSRCKETVQQTPSVWASL